MRLCLITSGRYLSSRISQGSAWANCRHGLGTRSISGKGLSRSAPRRRRADTRGRCQSSRQFDQGEQLRLLVVLILVVFIVAVYLCVELLNKCNETHRKAALRAHCKHAFKALRDVDAKDKEIKGEDFRHRNWFRSEKTLIAVGEQLNDLLQLYDDEMQKFRFYVPLDSGRAPCFEH